MFDNLFMHGDGQVMFNELIEHLGKITYVMDKTYGIYIEIISGKKYYPEFQYSLSTERYAILYEAYTAQKMRFNLLPHLEANACAKIIDSCKQLQVHTTEQYHSIVPRIIYQTFEGLSKRGY